MPPGRPDLAHQPVAAGEDPGCRASRRPRARPAPGWRARPRRGRPRARPGSPPSRAPPPSPRHRAPPRRAPARSTAPARRGWRARCRAGAGCIRGCAVPRPRAMRMLLSDPNPSRPPASFQIVPLKMPSPRLNSVIGQSPATAPVAASRRVSSSVMCVRWISVQRRSRRMVVEQPLDRPPAGGGHDLLDLGDLLGEVHVQRPLRPQARAERQRLGADRAQRVRRHADAGVGRQVRVAPPRRRRAAGRSASGSVPNRCCPGPSGRRSSAAELVDAPAGASARCRCGSPRRRSAPPSRRRCRRRAPPGRWWR